MSKLYILPVTERLRAYSALARLFGIKCLLAASQLQCITQPTGDDDSKFANLCAVQNQHTLGKDADNCWFSWRTV